MIFGQIGILVYKHTYLPGIIFLKKYETKNARLLDDPFFFFTAAAYCAIISTLILGTLLPLYWDNNKLNKCK